ncbi:hypothetical protein [Aquimarina macrocephali]|uniref:hypothetical protein n=1 Tax=Aquimarina macrocephali TaxID=666563 RepID=UPI0004672AD8|nr:hypothetical protein [Aquimarina macrocephali]
MPTNKPRIQVTLDQETNGLLSMLADNQDRSMSATAADLIREALELREDKQFSKISNQRIAEDDGQRHNHNDAWE